jgi:hypothetical protein
MGILILSLLVTAALVFGALFFLFVRNKSGKHPFKNIAYWITGLLATPILFVGCIYIWAQVSTGFTPKPFDQEVWLAEPEIRFEYVGDLVDSGRLNGLSSPEITTLLGEAHDENDSTMVYYLGYSTERFMNMIPSWLEIEMADGIANNAAVLK